MAPPGRRRANMPSPYTIILSLLFFFTTSASAAVLGIDFGTLNIKAALVKPGIPLEIVLTKDSKRKETAAVAFKPTRGPKNEIIAENGTFPERAYGSDALALQGRMPGEVFPNLKPLLGLPYMEGEENERLMEYKQRYPAVQAEQVKDMGTVLFKSTAFFKDEQPWSVEELLIMELANIRRNAEAMAGKGTPVEDVVITVPVFYTGDERRAIQRTAELAGFKVMALVSDGLAVGLDYAKSRTFPSVSEGGKPEHHIVFDMGAGSTTATLLRFQGRSVKDVGRYNKTVQEVSVLGAGWDRTLGGDSLTQLVVTDYIHKFLTKPAMKSRGLQAEEVRQNGRLMSRLWKDAEKARQVLSANTETTSSFEELLPDVDFRVKLTRTDFETLAAPYADRVAQPIRDALTAAKMTMKDIDSVIVYGGAMRTPFVQRKLEEFVANPAKIKSNVNADESAVFGAAFKAAGLSPSFKVKEIREADVAAYPVGIIYQEEGGKERKQALFTPTSPVGNNGTTKQIPFRNKDDFDFRVYQTVDGVDRLLSRIITVNLTESVAALKDQFGCEQADVKTYFSAKLSPVTGLPEVVSGSVSCETEAEAKSGGVLDYFGFGKKKKDQQDDEVTDSTEGVEASGTSSSSASSSSSGSASASKTPEKPKKRTESIDVAYAVQPQGLPQPPPKEMKRMYERLEKFDYSDYERYARETALNVLESFTYYTRDFLSNEAYEAVSTAAQREEISKLLQTTRDWMESGSDVAKATEDVLKEKLTALKDLVTPVQERKKDAEARPEKVKALKESLEQTNNLVVMVKEQIEKADEQKKKSSEEAAAASAASPSAADSDDLEDSETSTSSEAPKPTNAFTSPYTNEDLVSVKGVYESVSAWLTQKEAEQGKLSSHEQPVLTVKELEKKADQLSAVMMELLQKKMRTPPKASSSSSKTAKTSKTKSAKKSKSTSTAASETTEAPAASEKGPFGDRSKFMTVNSDDEMPTEEEILNMVKQAKGKGDEAKDDHDEL